MREPYLVESDLIDGVWKVGVSPWRGNNGELLGTVILENGDVQDGRRLVLDDPDARRTWAESVAGDGRPAAETLLATLTSMLKAAFEVLQEATARGSGRRAQPHDISQGRPAFPLTDWGNAERLVAASPDDFRWCDPWRSFVVFDDIRWVRSGQGLEVEAMAKRCLRSMYTEAGNIIDDQARQGFVEHIQRSESERHIKSMVALTRSEPGVSVSPAAFDQDSFLFNCANGTIDLRTGILREHRRDDLLTKVSPVAYDAAASAPVWEKFLARVLPSENVRRYVQRALGYSLTGDCGEHCLFLPHGGGRNGKSTLLEIAAFVMGDYARQTRPETLLAKDRGSIPNDVAALVGARFVPTVEVEEGRRLAESLVKQLTGGDTISARFLYGEFFTFRPVFKVWLAANHKPVIRGTDDAIWERIRLIPFGVTIPEGERDRHLLEKLEAEAPGILRWMVEGCLEWQRYGLQTPQEVSKATKSYQDEMDTLGDFLTECCVTDLRAKALASALYESYKTWCEEKGELRASQKVFGTKLGERGFTKSKDSKSNCVIWHGLGLRTEQPGPSGPSGPSKQETSLWGETGRSSRSNGPDHPDHPVVPLDPKDAEELAELDRLQQEQMGLR